LKQANGDVNAALAILNGTPVLQPAALPGFYLIIAP